MNSHAVVLWPLPNWSWHQTNLAGSFLLCGIGHSTCAASLDLLEERWLQTCRYHSPRERHTDRRAHTHTMQMPCENYCYSKSGSSKQFVKWPMD
eukprot:5584061-Amphidinium_carterae.1